jgi:hypothetical protein
MEDQTPIKQISENKEEKAAKFLGETIVKVSGPNVTFIEKILARLSVAFQCKPTSEVMYNHHHRQFYVYVSVAEKELGP